MDVLQSRSFLIALVAYYYAVDASLVQIPNENITAAHALRKHLFKNYDRVVVPATSKKPVQMKMTIVFNSVELSYDTSQMIFHAWMRAEWNDDRLTWNQDDYDQIKYTTVEPHEIWHPDFRAYNSIGVDVERGNTHALINSTGHVLWVPPVRYRVHCKTDMTRWPYDVQTGYLKIGSWVYSGKVINMTETTTLHEIMIVSPSPEWRILRISSAKITRLYPCCPDDLYDHVEFNVTIGREYGEHRAATVAVIIVPALSTALLNLLVFCISPDDKYKLITSLFNGLIVASILLVIHSKIPLILSSVPFIVLYYAYSLGLTILAAVISVALNNMTTASCKPLPKPINIFVQSRFVEMLQMEINRTTPDDRTDSKTVEFNRRQIFANIMDKICFAVFSCVYAFLLFRYIF